MATYWKIAAHSAYGMFSWYKYLIVSLVFSHLGFWSGNLFLIAPFPDLCLLVPFYIRVIVVVPCGGPKKSPRTSIECSDFSNPQGLFALVFFFCSGVSRLFGAQGSPSSGSLLNL